MASSSTSGHQVSTPAPPPPTPSNQSISKSFSNDADAALSCFLNQLLLNKAAPSLSSLPPRFAKRSLPAPPPPLVSLVDPRSDLLLSAATDIGFFHLSDHGIPSHLINRAVEEAQSLFHSEHANDVLSSLGFNHDEDEDDKGDDGFVVLDTCSTAVEALPAISECAKSLERVGLMVVEMILSAAGLCNPFHDEGMKPRCLIWVSSSPGASFDASGISAINEEEEEEEVGEMVKCYPYVVSLQYEMKASSVMGEAGEWITVDPSVDSVLVMLGDIAQVWSNGRFKKVRGIPRQNSASGNCNNSQGISISLLVTLPIESTLSPLSSLASNCSGNSNTDDNATDVDEGDEHEAGRERYHYRSFSFEEYAWRVYHDRFPFKDPLIRYKI